MSLSLEINDDEVQIMVAESQIKKLNNIQKHNHELTDTYTKSVQTFVQTGGTDSNILMDSYKKTNNIKLLNTTEF
jgi:hypothetical protein